MKVQNQSKLCMKQKSPVVNICNFRLTDVIYQLTIHYIQVHIQRSSDIALQSELLFCETEIYFSHMKHTSSQHSVTFRVGKNQTLFNRLRSTLKVKWHDVGYNFLTAYQKSYVQIEIMKFFRKHRKLKISGLSFYKLTLTTAVKLVDAQYFVYEFPVPKLPDILYKYCKSA